MTDHLSELTDALEPGGLPKKWLLLLRWARDEIVALRRRLDAYERPATVVIRERREADAPPTRMEPMVHPWPPGATSTTHPSLPGRFRSRLYYERERWDAHIKVDYDQKNLLSLDLIRRIAARPYAYLGSERVLRAQVHATRKGHHLRIYYKPELPRLSANVILGIQEMLNDDPMRQKLNAERVERNEPGFNVLWNRKFVNGLPLSTEEFDADLTTEVERILGVLPCR